MIIPNLMISDMARSVAFYRDCLGMSVVMSVMADRTMGSGKECVGAVFATLEWDDGQLMLQTVASLASELSVFTSEQTPTPSGTIYFRGLHPDGVVGRVSREQIVKGPELSWYGMMELYLRDPDGHIICLGAPGDAPPA